LVEGLLKRYNDVKVYCLVRASSEEAGLERISANLKNHHIWEVRIFKLKNKNKLNYIIFF